MMPLVWRIMKATASGVARSAAMMRSPSFSRSSSSMIDDHAPGAQLGEDLLDGAERCIRGSSLAGQGQDFGHAARIACCGTPVYPSLSNPRGRCGYRE